MTLSQTQVQAMYNTEMVPGLQATDLYGQGTMAKLFGLYSAETGSVQGRQPHLEVCHGLRAAAGKRLAVQTASTTSNSAATARA